MDAGGTYTTFQHTSYTGRVGNALKGVCVGLVLFVLSFPLLVWNEGNYVRHAAALDEVQGQVVEVDPADPLSPRLTNKAVHVSGAIELGEVRDDEYGMAVRALRLTRQPQSYQYVEHVTTRTEKDGRGGERQVSSYSYTRDWSTALATTLKDPSYAGKNPRGWRVAPKTVLGSATLGPYRLTGALLTNLGSETPLDPLNPDISEVGRALTAAAAPEGAGGAAKRRGGVAALPAPGKTIGQLVGRTGGKSGGGGNSGKRKRGRRDADADADGYDGGEDGGEDSSRAVALGSLSREVLAMTPAHGFLYTGDPARPAIGDNRVQWSAAAPESASIVGRQARDGSLAPIVASNGHEILLYGEGDQTVAQLFNNAHSANAAMTWLVRAGGWLLMLIGLLVIFQPASVLVEVVPFLGGFLSALVGGGLCLFAAAVATALSLVTIAVSWFAFRPLVAAGLAAAAAAVVFGFSRLRRGTGVAATGGGVKRD